MPPDCLSPRSISSKSKRSASENRCICQTRQHERGKCSRRSSSAAQLPSYQTPTIESENKRRGPVKQDYDATKYGDHGGESETSSDAEYDLAQAAGSRIYSTQKEPGRHGYCVQQTDEEESWITGNFRKKIVNGLYKLRETVDNIATSYNKEKNPHIPHPPEHKTMQNKRKATARPSVRPLSAVSEEILHLRKHIDVIDKAIQVLLKRVASEVRVQDLQGVYSRENELNDKITNELKMLQKTDKELVEVLRGKIASIDAENISLRSRQRNLEEIIDARERRNQALVVEITSKNEEITFYHSENRKLLEEQQRTGFDQSEALKEKITSLGDENTRLQRSLRSLQEEADALDRKNQELVLEISSLDRRNQEMVLEISSLNRRILEISTKREESTVYSSGKRRPVKEKEIALPVKISKTNEENTRLKRIESAHQTCEKKHKKNEAEIQRLKKIIDKQTSDENLLRYEVETVKKDCLKSQNRNKDYEGEMKKLEKRCREQRLEIDLKNQEISQLKKETATKSEQIKQTTVNIEIRKKETADSNLLKKKNEKLCEENTSLKENIKTFEEENRRLKRDLDHINKQTIEREHNWKRFANEKEKHLKGLEEEMTKKNREIDQMKVECKYIHGLENKHKELNATVSRIYQEKDSKIASLQSDIEGLSKRCETLKQKNVDYEGKIEEFNDIREDYKKLKKEYNDQERRLQDEKMMRGEMTREMERKMICVDQRENDLQMEKEENDRLRQEIAKLEKMEFDIISGKRSMESQRAEIEYKLQSKEWEVKELTHEIDRAREEIAVLQQEIHDGEQNKNKVSNHLRSRIESLEGEVVHAKERLSGMLKKNKQIEEEKRYAEKRCIEFEKVFRTKEEELKSKYEIARTDSLHYLNMEKEAQIRRLQDDNSSLHESQKHLLSKVERLQANVNTVKEEKALINNALLEKEKEISILNHELRRLQSENDIRKGTEKQKQAVVLEQKSIQFELDQVKARLNERNKEIKAAKDSEIRAQSAMKNLRTENTSLQSEVQHLTTRCSSLEEMQKTLDHLRREKAGKENYYRNVEKKNREYEKEVRELRGQLISLQDATDDSRKESEKETHDLLKENKALQGELEQMKLRLHSDAEEMKSLMKENEDKEELYLAAVNQVEEKERENTDLRRQCLGLEDVDKTVDHLRREISDKERYYRNLEKKNRENEEEVRKLRRQLKSLQEATNDNRKVSENLHTENKSLQGELQQIKSSAQAMEKELNLVKREKADKEKDYTNVEKKNRENEEEVKELRKQLKSFQEATNDKRKESENEMYALLRENKALQGELEQLKSRLRLDAEEMKSVMKENQDNKQLYLSSAKEVQEKERKIVDLQRLLSGFQDVEKKLDLVKRENADKEKDYRNVEKKNRENEEEVRELRRQLSSLQHRLDDQSMQTKAANENDVKLKASVENLQIDNSSLQSELQELRSRLHQANQNFEMVKKEKMDTEQYYWHIEKDSKKKEQEIEELRREIHRTGEVRSKYEAMQKEKERIQQISSELRRELQSKEQEIHSSREENSRLANKLVATEREADLLKKTYSHDENKGRVLLDEKTKIEKELADVKSSVAQLTKERNDLHRDKVNADKKCVKMAKEIKDREDEAERLADKLATTEETLSTLVEENARLRREQGHDLAGMNQKLQRENKTLQSELERVVSNFEEKISILNEENKKLRRSPDHSGGIIQKLERQNTSLQSELERVASNLDQLKRDYTEVKKEKDHALNRLSSVAGEKLRDNNPGIADLSDENRPINLGEKFSQLYDDQWTDAMENLEENLRFGETDGIRCLLNILKRVFDECVRISDDQFTQLKEITGTTNLPSDQLKKLKDLRKSTALQSVKNVKQVVNKTMSSFFSNEKIACQSYIDRSAELCWLMCVQDPPVVIDFTAVRGQEVNDKTFRKFTKTGSKIDFLVWPMIRLHRNGPLLQKGVVQPL